MAVWQRSFAGGAERWTETRAHGVLAKLGLGARSSSIGVHAALSFQRLEKDASHIADLQSSYSLRQCASLRFLPVIA